MAIEFQCPHCSAVLRVPDEFAGKKGTCPKCQQKMLVPVPTALEPAEPEQPPVVPSTAATAPPDTAAEPIPDFSAPPEPSAPPPVPYTEDGLPDFTAVTSAPAASISQRVKQRTERRWSALLWPLLFGSALVAGVVTYYWPSEQLGGPLEAFSSETIELPAVVFPKAELKADAEALSFTLADLEREPQMLKSPGIMDTEIRGSEEGLEFRLFPDPNATVAIVDVTREPALQKYVEQHAEAMDKVRREELSRMAGQFVEEWAKVRSNDPRALVPELADYRNMVALNALRNGLGYHVAAVVDRRVYQCVAESEGKLFFVLPGRVEKFELRGRTGIKTDVPFPAVYEVRVKREAASDDESPADPDTPVEMEEPDDGAGEEMKSGEMKSPSAE